MVGIYGFFFLKAVAVAEDEPLHGGVITRRTKKMRKKGTDLMEIYNKREFK